MKKAFKWGMLLTAGMLIGIGIIFYKPGIIKTPLESYLSKQIGYDIRINGELDFSAGREIRVRLSDVRASNPEWEAGGVLMSLQSLQLVLDAASLLDDPIIINSLQLDQLNLKLETNVKGLGNWAVSRPAAAKSQTEDTSPRIIFNRVLLNDIALDYQNGETGKTQVLQIDSFRQVQQDDGMLEIDLDATLNNRRVGYSGSIGPYENLLNGQDVAFKGSGNLGSLQIVAEGMIDDLLNPRRPDFMLELQGPDTDDITEMLGIDDLGSGAFSVSGRGETINGKYVADLDGNIGDLSLNLRAQASGLMDMKELDLELAINGPRLAAVTQIFGQKNWPDQPFSLKGSVARDGTNLSVPELKLNISGAKLNLNAELSNFPHLDAGRIDLLIEGDRIEQFRQLLGISGIASGAFKIQGKLDVSADEDQIIQLEAETSLGQATISGALGHGPTYAGTQLHISMDGHNANTLLSAVGIDALPEEPFRLDARVELLEQGLKVDRGVLVSINDHRLELGGLLVFKPGGEGSNVDFRLSGNNFAEMLGSLSTDWQVPASPYQLEANLDFRKDSILLNNGKVTFESIKLAGAGKISLQQGFSGTEIDLELSGVDISALEAFPALADSLTIFMSGLAYRLSGKLSLAENKIRYHKISGQIGSANLKLDGQLSLQETAADARFVIHGPNFHALFKDNDQSDHPIGAFSTAGEVKLEGARLSLDKFHFETSSVSAKAELAIGWPYNPSADIRFKLDIKGDDIRHFIPKTEVFEPAMAAYEVVTEGQLNGGVISLEKFAASIGNFQLSLFGKVDDDPSDRVTTFSIRASSKDISSIGRFNGELIPTLALNLNADFVGNANKFVIQKLDFSLGESRVNGSLHVSLAGLRPLIHLQLSSPNIDLRPFLLNEENTAPDENNSQRLIPTTPLPLAVLEGIDGEFAFNIKAINFKQSSLYNLIIGAKLDNGSLEVPEFTAEGVQGTLDAEFFVSPARAGNAEIKLDLLAEDLAFNFFGQSEERLSQLPAFDLGLRVKGTGDNLRELAGSLNGAAWLGSSGGVLEGVNLSILDVFFVEELLNMIVPENDDSSDLQLKCAAAIFNISDGRVETNPAIAFTTNKISLIAKGELNLHTEKIQFNFNTVPNKAYKFSASELINPYILVSGTLKNPSVGIDPAKALVRGGIAVGTAGISILAKGALDRLGNTTPLCEKMLEEVESSK
ncbi:MAG: AsmA family protein [Xanthomonadales bacterium]|nr:AsmA family protein [Xanthomonadales bacterium]